MNKIDPMETTEINGVLNRLSITQKAISKSLYRLEDVLNALDQYTEAMREEIQSLKEEGLTEKEETQLCLGLTRLRNSTLVKYCDML